MSNHVNPYQPPPVPEDDCPVAWPSTGAYLYHGTLVWHSASPLPSVCVFTGQPATTSQTFVLAALVDDDGSLTPTRTKENQQLHEFRLPTSSDRASPKQERSWGQGIWKRTRLLLLVYGAGLVLLFLPDLFGLGALGEWHGIAATTGIILGLAILMSGWRRMAGSNMPWLITVDRGYLQIGGLHPAFLMQLPRWPVPDRDSVK